MSEVWAGLYRTNRGHANMTVHRYGCRILSRVREDRRWPWLWAKGRSFDEVFAAPWNVPCRICRPEKALSHPALHNTRKAE